MEMVKNYLERHFNNNDILWDEKYFKIIKIWNIIFIIICMVNEYLYYINFHDNDELLIIIPFLNMLVPGILVQIREFINVPHGDKQYILDYYPEIYKIMFFPNISGKYSTKWSRLNGFKIFSFVKGNYINDKDDGIIDNIRERWNNHGKTLLKPIVILVIFVIITIINIGIKHGLE
jgi:hypothetical protein